LAGKNLHKLLHSLLNLARLLWSTVGALFNAADNWRMAPGLMRGLEEIRASLPM